MTKSRPRAAGYVRVSTKGQADHRISLADQEVAIARYCEAQGMDLVSTYVEAGASGTDEGRPVFQQMIEAATGDDHAFDGIVVHSASRFFRDAFQFEGYRRKLKRAKVTLAAVTQAIEGDEPIAAMTRHILTGFDEYQSAETGKHTRRTMIANAKAGYWNGNRPPFGYRAYVADLLGGKAKMKVELHPEEYLLVQRIFELYLEGDRGSGPMGLRKLIDGCTRPVTCIGARRSMCRRSRRSCAGRPMLVGSSTTRPAPGRARSARATSGSTCPSRRSSARSGSRRRRRNSLTGGAPSRRRESSTGRPCCRTWRDAGNPAARTG